MTCLKTFINDLANNDALKRHMPSIGELGWQKLKDEAALSAKKIWTEHLPPVGWYQSNHGVVSSYYNKNEGCNDPVKILRLLDGNYLVINYSSQCAIFSPDFLFLEWLPFGSYGNQMSVPGAYGNLRGGDINADNTRLALVSYGYHTIKCFDYLTGQELWSFGDGTPGNASDGRVYNPRDAVWLPNGNLMISSYNGRGDTAIGPYNVGFVAELDGATGALVEVHLEYGPGGGFSNRLECYYPTGLAMFDDHLYVCSYGCDEIGCFDVAVGFEYVRTYKKPAIVNEDGVNPSACCKGADGELIVYSAGLKEIAGLSLATGDLLWHAGIAGFDAFSVPKNQPHELWDVYGIIWDDSKQVTLAADYGNRRIQALSQNNTANIQYNVTPPDGGYHLVQMPEGYDEANQIMTLSVNELQTFGSSRTPGALVLGWEKDVE